MAGMGFNGIPFNLLASAARTTSNNTTSFKDSAPQIPMFSAAAFILDVTASSGPTTLDVTIDTSVDNGTTWYTAYEFGQVGAVSTAQRRLDIRDNGIGVTEVGAESSLASGSAIKVNTVVTRDIRIRWIISGTSYTFAVWAIFQPLGSQW